MAHVNTWEQYDPFEQRPKSQKITSTLATFAHLLNGIVGAGLLMLPYAFKTSGYLAALICSSVMSVVMIYTMVIMIKCSHRLCKLAKVPSLSFSGTVETAFRFGPKPLRAWSKPIGKFMTTLICMELYQTIVVYSIYVAELSQHVLGSASGIEYDLRLCLVVLVPFFFLISLVPDFRVLTGFSLLGFTFIVMAVLCSFYYFFKEPFPISALEKFTSIEGVSSYCAIFVFNLDVSTTVMSLENSMKSPKKMPVVISIAMALSAIIFVSFGFFGYKKYPNPCDTVIKNLPTTSPVSIAVNVLTAISVLFNYGLHFLILVTLMWPMVSNQIKSTSNLVKPAFCILAVFLSTSEAILVPQLIPVVEVASGVLTSTFMFLTPIVVETLTVWNDPGQRKFVGICLKNFVIFIIYVLISVVATIENLTAIINELPSLETEESCLVNSTISLFVDL